MNETPKQKSVPDIDELLAEIDQASSGPDLSEVEDLLGEIDSGVGNRQSEINSWNLEQKRKEAADSTDPFVLNQLSTDENFNVRMLVLCNEDVPDGVLRRELAAGVSPYTLLIIANNKKAPTDILDRVAEMTNESEVLSAIKANPNTSVVTKKKLEVLK
jgi:hypothetical protein